MSYHADYEYKSWIPDKNVDKLRKVIEQNERRRELIDKICCVW